MRGHGEVLTLILLAIVILGGWYIYSIYSSGECVHIDLTNGGSCNTSFIYKKLPGQACPAVITGFGASGSCAAVPGSPTALSTSTPDVLPTVVGTCNQTTVVSVTPPAEGSLSTSDTITYTNGGTQVTNQPTPGILDSTAGDLINLCLVSYPSDCPQGDTRGLVYSATNLRTFEHWQAPNSDQVCGSNTSS